MDYKELENGTRNNIAKLEVDYQLILMQLKEQTNNGALMPDSALHKKAIDINKELHLY